MSDKQPGTLNEYRSPEFKKQDSGNNTKHAIVATVIAVLAAIGAYEFNSNAPSTPLPTATKVAK